jgi:hypothetical protein
MPQLGASLRPGTGRDGMPGSAAQCEKELVEMELEGFDGFLKHQQHDEIKAQLAPPGKGFVAGPMPLQKALVAKKSARPLHHQNRCEDYLHPHCE